MKIKIFTLFFLMSVFVNLNAQMLLEENFDYEANRTLILNPIVSSDNYDGVTGWSTQSNSTSNVNCFNITSAPLTYNGYVSSGVGNALKYLGDAGQGVFKLFTKNIKNDSAVYISFLINFPSTPAITGGDYFMGIKMEPAATSTNWGGRLYAAIDPGFPNEEVIWSINKSSTGTKTTVNPTSGPFFAANTTHMIVLKYKVGKLNGANATEETNNYDDEMWLYVNPAVSAVEPATATLYQKDPTQKDLYRYTSTGSVFGGARGFYLRASAAGNAPAYTIDDIRVGLNWTDVIRISNSLKQTTSDDFSFRILENELKVYTGTQQYTRFILSDLSGKPVMSGKLQLNQTDINTSDIGKGVFILTLDGLKKASAKIIL